MAELGLELRAPNSSSDSSPGPSFSLSSLLRAREQPLTLAFPNTHSEPQWDGGGDEDESGSVLKTLHSRGKDSSSTLTCDETGLPQVEKGLGRAFQAK